MPKRKSFIDEETGNPALAFISETSIKAVEDGEETKEQELKAPTGEKPPKGYKYNPLYIETKTKRVQLVFQPSLYEKIRAASKAAGLSFNEFCHRALSEATKEESED